MDTQNGVIDKTTGDLKRCGFCDFENDGSLDVGTEEYRTDVPFPAYVVNNESEPTKKHNWNGSGWTVIVA